MGNNKLLTVMFSGKMGSGKTTSALALREAAWSLGWDVHHSFFAEAIYSMHDMILAQMASYDIHYNGPKHRELLQFLGTDFGRKTFGEGVWTNVAINKRNKIFADAPENSTPILYLISDCRFKKEFEAFPDALRIRVTCNEADRLARISSGSNQDHISETDLDTYAVGGLFDMYANTSIKSPEGIAVDILSKLQQNTWVDERPQG